MKTPTLEGGDPAVSAPDETPGPRPGHPGDRSPEPPLRPLGEFVDEAGAAAAEAPKKSQLIQLFVFPMLIAAVGVGIFFLFWYLTHERRTFDEYLVALRSKSETQRYQAAYDLAEQLQREGPEFVGPDGAQKLADLFAAASGEPQLRQFLAAALARIADPVAVPALVEGLKDEALEVKLLSAAALGKVGDAGAVDALVAATEDESHEVRASAAASLGAIRSARAVPALKGLLSDRDPIVRAQAAVSLAYLGDASGVPTLVESIDRSALARNERLSGEDDVERVMRSAIVGLAEIKSPEARPALERVAANDTNLRVQAAAREALRRYDAPPPVK